MGFLFGSGGAGTGAAAGTAATAAPVAATATAAKSVGLLSELGGGNQVLGALQLSNMLNGQQDPTLNAMSSIAQMKQQEKKLALEKNKKFDFSKILLGGNI